MGFGHRAPDQQCWRRHAVVASSDCSHRGTAGFGRNQCPWRKSTGPTGTGVGRRQTRRPWRGLARRSRVDHGTRTRCVERCLGGKPRSTEWPLDLANRLPLARHCPWHLVGLASGPRLVVAAMDGPHRVADLKPIQLVRSKRRSLPCLLPQRGTKKAGGSGFTVLNDPHHPAVSLQCIRADPL